MKNALRELVQRHEEPHPKVGFTFAPRRLWRILKEEALVTSELPFLVGRLRREEACLPSLIREDFRKALLRGVEILSLYRNVSGLTLRHLESLEVSTFRTQQRVSEEGEVRVDVTLLFGSLSEGLHEVGHALDILHQENPAFEMRWRPSFTSSEETANRNAEELLEREASREAYRRLMAPLLKTYQRKEERYRLFVGPVPSRRLRSVLFSSLARTSKMMDFGDSPSQLANFMRFCFQADIERQVERR
jgi:hypothetical protein